MESISQFGVISPLLARPDPDGGYEIVSGHRRHHAAQPVGLETVPVIVREMDDVEAIIAMVDSNLQRETILPSERAWAYKMKMDAIKHQGTRADLRGLPRYIAEKDMKKAKKMDTMIGARAHWRTINILSIDVIIIRLF